MFSSSSLEIDTLRLNPVSSFIESTSCQIQAVLFPIMIIYPIKIRALLNEQDVFFFLFKWNLLTSFRHFKQQLPQARARKNLSRTELQKTPSTPKFLENKKMSHYSGLFSEIWHLKVSTLSSHDCMYINRFLEFFKIKSHVNQNRPRSTTW